MQAVKTIGLDIAKSVFQVHGIDADGQPTGRRCGAQAALRAPGACHQLASLTTS
jgi:hypothetical protein